MRRRDWYLLAAITLFALAIRLAWVIKIAPETRFGDQEEYTEGALRLLRGEPLAQKNWMLFVRAPGYSVFIAFVWALAGAPSMVALRLAQAVLSTATCAYIYFMARLLWDRTLAAPIALLAAAIYPYHIFLTAAPGSETLFAFFVASGAYHLARGLDETARLPHLILAGVLFGLGNQVRPNLATMLPLLGLWIACRGRSSPRQVLRVAFALGVPILLVTLPWTLSVRNQGLGWIFVTDGGGIWYFNGHNDEAYSLYCETNTPQRIQQLLAFPDSPQFTARPEYLAAKAAAPADQQKVFWRLALEWDRAHLSSLPCLMAHKLWGYWRPWLNPDAYGRAQVLVSLAALPLLVLGLVGVCLAWRDGERPLSAVTLINIATGTIVAVLFSTQIRYRVPLVDVLLLPFFGLAVARLAGRVGGRLR